jgi:histone acetyltransferase (RNA polymerase elongator complex component)
LHPHMVRIHPTLVLSGTDLAKSFRAGEYRPLSLTEAVTACCDAWKKFSAVDIPVVRFGLQSTPALEQAGSVLAGPYHPALGALVETALFFEKASRLLSQASVRDREITVSLAPRDASSFRGQRNRNLQALRSRFGARAIRVNIDPSQQPGDITVTAGQEQWHLTDKEFTTQDGISGHFSLVDH